MPFRAGLVRFGQLRVGLVNDSPKAIDILTQILNNAPRDYTIVWVAHDGQAAIAQCQLVPPDLVLMDLLMPVMGGVEATQRIMQQCPCAIVVVTRQLAGRASLVLEAVSAGALDALPLPSVVTPEATAEFLALLYKVRVAGYQTYLAKEGQGSNRPIQEEARTAGLPTPPLAQAAVGLGKDVRRPLLVLIGASTGGPAALVTVLSRLPVTFRGAIVVVQHIDANFTAGLATWLNEQIPLPVRQAQTGDRPEPGQVLLVGGDQHIVLQPNLKLAYTVEPAALPYKPSVDVLFQSMACYWPATGVAMLLTGIGQDGAVGLKQLRDRGWHTMAQEASSCAVYGMPKAAVELAAAVQVLSLEAMAAVCLHRVMLG